jgi:hypothetical protein
MSDHTNTLSKSAASKKKEAVITIDWSMKQLPENEGFLWEMGTGLGTRHNNGAGIAADGDRFGSYGGYAPITLNEVFRYMRHGATFYEAARLSEFKSIDEWEQDEDFKNASAKCHTKFAKVIDLIESKNLKTAEAVKLIQNGITDALFESSMLTEEQTLSVFSRFKYTHFTASKTSKEIPAMMDALLAGNLPYDIFESGYDKKSVTKLCSDLYGEPGKKPELSAEEREEIKSSPETITLLMELMKLHQPKESYYDPFRSIGVTYRALKEFGEDNVRKVHPETLLSKLRDGSYMGPEGAATAQGFVDYCEASGKFRSVSARPTTMGASVGDGTRAGFSIALTDSVDMSNAGVPDAAIVHMLLHRGMSVDEIIELAHSTDNNLMVEGEL